MRQKLFLSIVITLLMTVGPSVYGQSLKKQAKHVRSALTELDLDLFISLYADTIRYSDPNFGTDNHFPRATVRQFFEPLFVENSSFDLKLMTVAIDELDHSIIIKGDAFDQNEQGRLPFLVYLKFERGKIVHQIDFPVYSIETLRGAPRYKGVFKEKGG